MKYVVVLLAIVALLVIITLPNLSNLSNSGGVVASNSTNDISADEVAKTAANFVETTMQSTHVTNTSITSHEGNAWKITVNYQQGTGANCKVGRCYWEGPAAMFCRPETTQSLGKCQ